MRASITVLVLLLSVCGCKTGGISREAMQRDLEQTGARLRALPTLSDTTRFPEALRDAVLEVAHVVREEGDDPSEFHVEYRTNASESVVFFDLWFSAGLAPGSVRIAGNPGGRSRTVSYDLSTKRASPSRFWQ